MEICAFQAGGEGSHGYLPEQFTQGISSTEKCFLFWVSGLSSALSCWLFVCGESFEMMVEFLETVFEELFMSKKMKAALALEGISCSKS